MGSGDGELYQRCTPHRARWEQGESGDLLPIQIDASSLEHDDLDDQVYSATEVFRFDLMWV